MPVAIWFNSPILINIQILVVSSEKLIRFFFKNVLSRISAAHNKFNIGMKVIRTFDLYAGLKYVATDWIFSVYGFFFLLFVLLCCNSNSFFRSIEMNENKEKYLWWKGRLEQWKMINLYQIKSKSLLLFQPFFFGHSGAYSMTFNRIENEHLMLQLIELLSSGHRLISIKVYLMWQCWVLLHHQMPIYRTIIEIQAKTATKSYF